MTAEVEADLEETEVDEVVDSVEEAAFNHSDHLLQY